MLEKNHLPLKFFYTFDVTKGFQGVEKSNIYKHYVLTVHLSILY